VIHAHNVKVTAVALLAKALAAPSRPPVVATFHGVVPAEYRRAARILRRADAVACVSRELRDRAVAAGVPPARASVVPNAVEPSPPLNAAKRAALEAELALDARPLIVSVGRLVPEKAHHRLLDAVALLVGEGTPVRLLIVGEGPLGAALHRQVARLGLQEAVTLTGLRHDARDLIARADLVALTSDSEGLPLVVLEALGAGVPVVSTAVPGTTELLSSGAGTVVGDFTAEAVARALSQVLGDPALRERQGEEGRRLVATRHSLAAMVEGYRDLYRTVVSGAPRRARRVRPNARP
jgi:glycosyltransferase involved in cell wall biosynthesis